MNPHILGILRLYQALYRLDSDSPQAFTKVVSYRPYRLSPSTAVASYSPIVYPPLLWLFHTVLSSTPLYCGYFIRILSSTALHYGCFIQLYRLRPSTAAASCNSIVYGPLLQLLHTALIAYRPPLRLFHTALSSTALYCRCFIQLYRLRPFTAAASYSPHRLPPSMLVAPYNP